MIHFYSHYDPQDPEAVRCCAFAKQTWDKIGWIQRPVLMEELPRLFTLDNRAIPFVRDVFDIGTRDVNDEEICVYTNLDIQIRSDTDKIITSTLNKLDACYCFRRDFPPGQIKPIPDHSYHTGHNYCGSDMYAFKAKWWRANRTIMPDMLIAHELWDAILRHLVDMTHVGECTGLLDLCAHEKNGDSWWEKPQNRYRLRGQIHNLTHGVRWLKAHGFNPAHHGVPNHFGRMHISGGGNL